MGDHDGIIQNRAVSDSQAEHAIAGTQEIGKVRKSMTSFIETVCGASSGKFITQIGVTNGESEVALAKLSAKLVDFAHGEKSFAQYLDLIDEEAAAGI